MEYDPSILKILQKMLQSLGYKVLHSGTPETVMEMVKKHTGAIDMLITDIIMLNMNGSDPADQLQSIHPDLKCVFMSGYTADIITSRGILDKEVNFIQKPFPRMALAKIVRKVLDENKNWANRKENNVFPF